MYTTDTNLMNYIKIHNQIIENRRTNPLSKDTYGENHHIIPSSLGGSDDASNIVRLTPKEHYVVHHLLWRHHRCSKTAHAFFNMLRCSGTQKRTFTARQHSVAIEAHVEAMKETMKGEGNHFYGRKHTEETKERIRQKQLGKKHTKECREKMSKARKGVPKSEEHKRKIGRKGFTMLKNFDTGEVIRISKEEADNYDRSIWKSPASIQKKIACKYCGRISTVGNINRWHNDNCKSKPA